MGPEASEIWLPAGLCLQLHLLSKLNSMGVFKPFPFQPTGETTEFTTRLIKRTHQLCASPCVSVSADTEMNVDICCCVLKITYACLAFIRPFMSKVMSSLLNSRFKILEVTFGSAECHPLPHSGVPDQSAAGYETEKLACILHECHAGKACQATNECWDKRLQSSCQLAGLVECHSDTPDTLNTLGV